MAGSAQESFESETRFDSHFDAVSCPKSQLRLQHHWVARDKFESPFLSQRSEAKHTFDSRKCFTETRPATGRKGEIGESWPRRSLLRCPAARIKLLWVAEPTWIALRYEGRDDRDGACWDCAVANPAFTNSLSSNRPDRRI